MINDNTLPAPTGEPSVEVAPTLDDLYAEWSIGFYEKLKGNLRQARAAGMLERHYGKASVPSFAQEMRVSDTLVYEYAAAWHRLRAAYPSETEIFRRLEDSPLRIWQIIEGTRGISSEHIPQALDEIEDQNKSVPRIRYDRAEAGKPENVEMITEVVCPDCGSVNPMHRVQTREVPA